MMVKAKKTFWKGKVSHILPVASDVFSPGCVKGKEGIVFGRFMQWKININFPSKALKNRKKHLTWMVWNRTWCHVSVTQGRCCYVNVNFPSEKCVVGRYQRSLLSIWLRWLATSSLRSSIISLIVLDYVGIKTLMAFFFPCVHVTGRNQ